MYGSEGTSLNYKYRMHDPRLGRFFAVDPLANRFPWNSPYAFSENQVIHSVELEGLEVANNLNENVNDLPEQTPRGVPLIDFVREDVSNGIGPQRDRGSEQFWCSFCVDMSGKRGVSFIQYGGWENGTPTPGVPTPTINTPTGGSQPGNANAIGGSNIVNLPFVSGTVIPSATMGATLSAMSDIIASIPPGPVNFVPNGPANQSGPAQVGPTVVNPNDDMIRTTTTIIPMAQNGTNFQIQPAIIVSFNTRFATATATTNAILQQRFNALQQASPGTLMFYNPSGNNYNSSLPVANQAVLTPANVQTITPSVNTWNNTVIQTDVFNLQWRDDERAQPR